MWANISSLFLDIIVMKSSKYWNHTFCVLPSWWIPLGWNSCRGLFFRCLCSEAVLSMTGIPWKKKILKKSINYVKGGSSYCKLCGNRRKCNYSHLRAVGIDTSEKENNMAKCPPVFCLCRGGSRNFGRGEGQNFWKLVSSRSMLNQVQMTQSKHCCVITSLSYVFAGAMSKLNFVVS